MASGQGRAEPCPTRPPTSQAASARLSQDQHLLPGLMGPHVAHRPGGNAVGSPRAVSESLRVRMSTRATSSSLPADDTLTLNASRAMLSTPWACSCPPGAVVRTTTSPAPQSAVPANSNAAPLYKNQAPRPADFVNLVLETSTSAPTPSTSAVSTTPCRPSHPLRPSRASLFSERSFCRWVLDMAVATPYEPAPARSWDWKSVAPKPETKG